MWAKRPPCKPVCCACSHCAAWLSLHLHAAAGQPLIQLHTSLLLRLIKVLAAVPDACLKAGHETEETEAQCSRQPVCFFRLLCLMFSSIDKDSCDKLSCGLINSLLPPY